MNKRDLSHDTIPSELAKAGTSDIAILSTLGADTEMVDLPAVIN